MDKKNTFVGIFLLTGAVLLMLWQGNQLSKHARELEPPSQELIGASAVAPPDVLGTPVSEERVPAKVEVPSVEEQLYTLENDEIEVTFTTLGAAVKTVALKKYPAIQFEPEPVVFNEYGSCPALAFSLPDQRGKPVPYSSSFKLVRKSAKTILFELVSPNGLIIRRGYCIYRPKDSGDPYVIRHQSRFINKAKETLSVGPLFVNLGTVPPTEGDVWGEYLNVGYYDGEKPTFVKMSKFKGSKGVMGIGQRPPLKDYETKVSQFKWGSVKNQFFAGVLTPSSEKEVDAIYVQPVALPVQSVQGKPLQGITAEVVFAQKILSPGQEQLMDFTFYVGPKEFTRLEALGQRQDLVMQFGFFGGISKILLVLMTKIHHCIATWPGSWGITIILVTVLIKLCLWPLTTVQVRSSKRMAKLQGPMKELREKYKDNPQKMQAETLKIFKENRVNPAAGCLPLLIQIPIFFGLFFMLRTSSDLRFANFLWIDDLSLPDTVAYIGSFPLHLLPLVMGVTMFAQMKMAPTPTTDNFQRKLFQFMPFIFLVFCYNFPSGLVLYWTVQNLLTIAQQMLTGNVKETPIMPSKKGKNTKK